MKFKQFVAIVAALALFALTGYWGVRSAATLNDISYSAELGAFNSLSSLIYGGDAVIDLPSEPFAARIDIVGAIGPSADSAYSYDHALYMDLVDALIEDEDNQGILLYVDSPGGTVYESDEFYLKLMEYREKTERPVYAYFASEACSGAYYISMAADEIYANRNGWTGSIGVIMSWLNYKELAEKIGVKEINIVSGRNKAMGSAWEDLTGEQEVILQSLIDEAYGQFVDIVAKGRNLERERALELADGRIYSAQQALERGLIDHIAGEQDALRAILEKIGLDPDDDFYSPERAEGLDFTVWDFVSRAAGLRPKSELEIFQELVSDGRNGALMYYAG